MTMLRLLLLATLTTLVVAMETMPPAIDGLATKLASKPVYGDVQPGPIAISLSTREGQEVYTEGEQVGLSITVDKACHLYVLLVSATGEANLLFPNAFQPDAKVTPGDTWIPSREAGFRFPVQPPHGAMIVQAIASQKPLALQGFDRALLLWTPFIYLGNPITGVRLDGQPYRPLRRKALRNDTTVGGWSAARMILQTQPMPAYDSSANDAVVKKWETLATASKDLFGGIGIRAAHRVEADQVADGVITYFKNAEAGTKAIGIPQEDGLGGPDSPLASARTVTAAAGTKALGDTDVDKQLEALRGNPNVSAATKNYRRHMFGDPKFRPVQWALGNTFKPAIDIGWEQAKKRAAEITPVPIAVIDQGLITTDPRLQALTWTNPKEVAGNGKDDDGNGLIDDVSGWNFITNSPKLYFAPDQYSHGSFCSSIIAGRRTGAVNDVFGIAPKAQLITAVALGAEGHGHDMAILKSLVYCAEQGAKVINLSLGGETTPLLFAEYQQAHKGVYDLLEKKGVILVCAAGNSNANNDRRPVVPANIERPNIITVMAVDADGAPTRGRHPTEGTWHQFTNYGATTVDIAAPGSLILGIQQEGRQELGDGTSFAAPIVTATLGLVWGQHPDWDYQTVLRAVTATAKPVELLKGRCITGGIVQIDAALNWTPN